MYTNGYTGTYTLELTKYFRSGYGLTFIIYPIADKQTKGSTLYKSGSFGGGGTGTELLLNNSTNNFSNYEQHTISYWGTDSLSVTESGSKNSLLESKINILTIFNNNGIIETNFNGNLSQSTTTQSLSFAQFKVNAGSNYILLAVAVTRSKNITYPLNKNSDVLSYVDFSDPNNPTINGDTSLLIIDSKSITSTSTPQLQDESVIDKIKITDNTLYGNASMQWVENLLTKNEGVLNGDISRVGNTLTLSLTEINVKITMKSTSTTSCSLTYYPIDGNTINPIDIRRCTIYGSGSATETYTTDNGSLTASGIVVDSTVYTQSNDTSVYFIRVKGIIYIVTVWISANGARTSLIYRKVV